MNPLERTAYIRWMTTKKIGDLRTEITLLQYGFADELIAGIYYACQSALGNKSILYSGLTLSTTLLYMRNSRDRTVSSLARALKVKEDAVSGGFDELRPALTEDGTISQ